MSKLFVARLVFVLVIVVSAYAIGAQRFLMGRGFGEMLPWLWADIVGWIGALACVVIQWIRKLREKKD